MHRLLRLLTLLGCAAALAACNDKPADEPAGSEIRRYTIASHRIYVPDAISDMPVLCLLVKPEAETNWQTFSDRIEGFTYVPGTEYDVELEIIPIAEPPADASDRIFRLHRVLQQEVKVSADLPDGAVCR